MKSFLTIRGNLLFINLVVIGLILWLAISFLHIAVVQRSDAQQLLANVDAERTIFQATNELWTERDSFDHFLNSLSEPTSEQYHQLTMAGLKSDATLQRIAEQVLNQIADLKLFEDSPAKRTILKDQLEDLNTQRIQLVDYRQYLLTNYFSSTESFRYVFLAQLLESQTDTIEVLISLANSLRYLPEGNASAISNYQALINKVHVAGVDFSRKNTALNNILSGTAVADLESRVQIGVLNQRIRHSLEEIILLAKASDNATQLLPIAENMELFYRQDYQKAVQRVYAHLGVFGDGQISVAEWRETKIALSNISRELAAATYSSIEALAERHGARATRNLLIDVSLVLLCFLITLASILVNRKVKQYAYHDRLTRLPNRMSFESAIQNTSVFGSQMHAVIFIDLDRFKSINDNYGHTIGDELLIEVAARLKRICKPGQVLARMGGDEFAVFVPDVQFEQDVELLAASFVATVKDTVFIRGLSLKVGASAGYSISPVDGESVINLLKNSDIAMYYNKTNKLNGVCRFDQKMASEHQQRLQLELDLKRALENNEFRLVYQPKVCTLSGQVRSVEALLRWTHPERGVISPQEFVPVAEDTGLMGTIGQWVLHESCREIALVQRNSFPALKLAVNISAQQFCDDQFVELVHSALRTHGFKYEDLELEVTESLIMKEIERVISLLQALKDSGISVAIDDFGTGYSSLQYLQQLPLNTLKIDRAFITALDSCDPHDSVANSIVQLAKLFNLETVAEGVETEEQGRKIRSLGVHYIQGYLYSEPVPASELPATVERIAQQLELQNSSDQQHAA